MLEQVTSYAKGMNANQEVVDWINSVFKNYEHKKFLALKPVPQGEIEHIIDYLVSSAAPARLRKMSYPDAKRKADEWSKAQQKKGRDIKDGEDDIETTHDFLDGTRIVRLKTKSALQREGFLMSHCVGGYSPDDKNCLIYSYRDSKNMPHATFEVRKQDEQINQIKGKGNGPIHPKYIHPILAFLKSIGMEVRPQEMQNLGYYHLAKEHLDYLKQAPKAWAQVTMINGEAYAHD